MTERAPKLEWKDRGAGTWQAFAGEVLLTVSEYSDDLRAFWRISIGGRDGTRGSLLAAQLAAEDAALTWLREGVEALGGRVLTSEQVALCVEALHWTGTEGDERIADGRERAEMLALAREMGGGT